MSETKPSSGAMRAAEILATQPSRGGRLVTLETAAIIERETHAGEMQKLLERIAYLPIGAADASEKEILATIESEARTLLQRIEGGAE